jgi:hypothetical protein
MPALPAWIEESMIATVWADVGDRLQGRLGFPREVRSAVVVVRMGFVNRKEGNAGDNQGARLSTTGGLPKV